MNRPWLACWLSLAMIATAPAVTVQFNPGGTLSIAPEQAIDLVVELDQNFETGIALFGVKLLFDPSRVALAPTPVTVASALNHNYSNGPADIFVGSDFISVIGITVLGDNGFDPYIGRHLATFHFEDRGIAGDPYSFTLNDVDSSTQWASPDLVELDEQVSYGASMLVAVPEPGTAILLLGALSSLLRRQR